MESKTENSEFSYEDGLKTIYAMIESTKGSIGVNYLYFLIWGYLVALASILEYVLIRVFAFTQHYLVWPVLMGLGLLFSAAISWRQKHTTTHRSFIGTIMGYLWIGWLVTFFILLFYSNVRNDFNLIIPITLVLYGLGVFVSGGILTFRPLILGGAVAWAASVVSFFLPYGTQLLLMFGTVIVSYIIPGHLLFRESQKQSS